MTVSVINHTHGLGQMSRLCVHEEQNAMPFVQIVERVPFLFHQQAHDSGDRVVCANIRNNIYASSKLYEKIELGETV